MSYCQSCADYEKRLAKLDAELDVLMEQIGLLEHIRETQALSLIRLREGNKKQDKYNFWASLIKKIGI